MTARAPAARGVANPTAKPANKGTPLALQTEKECKVPNKNTRRPRHYDDQIGPLSTEGVEATDLPDKGRGSVDTNIGKHLKRKTPDRTGGTPQETGGDVGMRAMPDSADAYDHGH